MATHLCVFAAFEMDSLEDEHAALTAHVKEARGLLRIEGCAAADATQNELGAIGDNQLFTQEMIL